MERAMVNFLPCEQPSMSQDPKRIRERLGLRGNDQVEITERDGRIEIEPAPTGVELVREGSVLVARPERPLPPLTDEIVRETLDRTRR